MFTSWRCRYSTTQGVGSFCACQLRLTWRPGGASRRSQPHPASVPGKRSTNEVRCHPQPSRSEVVSSRPTARPAGGVHSTALTSGIPSRFSAETRASGDPPGAQETSRRCAGRVCLSRPAKARSAARRAARSGGNAVAAASSVISRLPRPGVYSMRTCSRASRPSSRDRKPSTRRRRSSSAASRKPRAPVRTTVAARGNGTSDPRPRGRTLTTVLLRPRRRRRDLVDRGQVERDEFPPSPRQPGPRGPVVAEKEEQSVGKEAIHRSTGKAPPGQQRADAAKQQAAGQPEEEGRYVQIPDQDRSQPGDHQVAEPDRGETVDQPVLKIDVLWHSSTHAGQARGGGPPVGTFVVKAVESTVGSGRNRLKRPRSSIGRAGDS